MKEKLFLEPQRITAVLIAETKNDAAPRELIFVSPDDPVSDALAKMNETGITQLPVLADGRSVGSLRENRILGKLIENRDLLEAKVSEVMEDSFPSLEVDTTFAEIKSQLKEHPAVLIEDFKRITGIITRSDLLDLN